MTKIDQLTVMISACVATYFLAVAAVGYYFFN